MVGKINNFFLINAPAGSGKTTRIKAMIKESLTENPRDNILCITYTNRATNELLKEINLPNVFISTIHSFLISFIKPYLNHQDILDLYIHTFSKEIEERISSNKENIIKSNNNYIEKYGVLNLEMIRKNIDKISYNESKYSALYYGRLSHDDLIFFTKKIIDTFPILRKRISAKYQLVFIDEYQDTTAEILKLFHQALENTTTKLYLFGDQMQQIYKNYDGSFETQLKSFDRNESLKTNYRSCYSIIKLLNNIYNDDNYKQSPENEKNIGHAPKIIICDDMEKILNQINTEDHDTLTLYLLNRDRFKKINAENIYVAFSRMESYRTDKKTLF